MWKITLLTLVCLSFVLDYSKVACASVNPTSPISSVTTTKKTTTKPPSITTTTRTSPAVVVSTSPKASVSVTNKVGGPVSVTPKPVVATTTPPQKFTCSRFNCVGDKCYTNATNVKSCQDNFCVINTFNNGSYITVAGSCAVSCTDQTNGDAKTHCCKADGCNMDENEISPLLKRNKSAGIWNLSFLLLFIMQTVAIALNA